MEIYIALVSILAITVLVWLADKILPFNVCPICAGVSLTWLWMLTARFLGYEANQMILAMLMGASVVGFAFQFSLLKVIFIPIGFVVVYAILTDWWEAAVISLIFAGLSVLLSKSLLTKSSNNPKVNDLINKMKNCC